MRCELFVGTIVLLAMSCAVQAFPPGGELMSDRVLLTRTEAVVQDPPALVAAPPAAEAQWSRTGSCMLIWRRIEPFTPSLWTALHPPSADQLRNAASTLTLLAWNRTEGRVREVVSLATNFSPARAHWLGASSTALLAIQDRVPPATPSGQSTDRTRLLRVDAAAGRAEWLSVPDLTAHAFLDIVSSPTTPVAIVYCTAVGTLTGGSVGPQGELHSSADHVTLYRAGLAGGVERIAEADSFGPIAVVWAADGSVALRTSAKSTEGAAAPPSHWQRIDPATGVLTDRTQPPKPAPPAARPALQVVETQAGVGDGGAGPKVPVLWLAASGEDAARALLATDATQGLVSPDGSAVAYRSRGALWVVELHRMPRDVFDPAWTKLDQQYREALRTVAMSNCRQVGLALLLYATNTDRRLPTAADFGDVMASRLRSTSVTDGFMYLMDGQRLSDIAEPASTIMGYVAAPGGRAVVYADGHAAWIPDQR